MFRTGFIRSTHYFQVKPIPLCFAVTWLQLGYFETSLLEVYSNCPVGPFVGWSVSSRARVVKRKGNAVRQKGTSLLATDQSCLYKGTRICREPIAAKRTRNMAASWFERVTPVILRGSRYPCREVAPDIILDSVRPPTMVPSPPRSWDCLRLK